ncbi:Alpha-1,4-glucan:maltose-1-phosphate maltosyltransferase 1 [Jeotgalibaca dankookensis]|uniref:Alpha-1,4-glucan:maltose-1-phosphate maltosyltransferase 1 n=1 Tax=Jeotgalibaca dankookensis TaxID=708126 RepID=A0A1S6IMD0_9LACT|nr:alpha-amylase family glycosyl hydrolase [Jeotgalibaca dankookensis]AQS52700.1 Alpha-1,4-glucan:maltose-1-phosphate maltosyltransferase 1 [Jeotgalibaca dankookensis]
MAKTTDISLRNQVMYSIYVRNHTVEGTFEAIIPDLPRIKALGVDIIWLMPIHPIGEEKRKGQAGSPYAIRDYRAINPEYGDEASFKKLVDAIHQTGMKCIIDVVYNHTSPDSVLVKEHPEWFYRRPDGQMGNKVGDWYDIVDLDYQHQDLWDYQIETLKMWAKIVDGFRCDVASLLPIDFWLRARQEVAEVNPDTLWLAESVHPHFLREHRDNKNIGLSDNEVFEAFDITYDYDVEDFYSAYLNDEISLKAYLGILMFQDGIYATNYVKLRFLENHDHPRFRSRVSDPQAVRNWVGFLYFQKGTTLLYGGQEKGIAHLPDLFNVDPINWEETDMDLAPLMKKLYDIKGDLAFRQGAYHLYAHEGQDVVIGSYKEDGKTIHGIFNLDGRHHNVEVTIPDGRYQNQLDQEFYVIEHGHLQTRGEPIIFS